MSDYMYQQSAHKRQTVDRHRPIDAFKKQTIFMFSQFQGIWSCHSMLIASIRPQNRKKKKRKTKQKKKKL